MHYGDTNDPEIGLRFNLPKKLTPLVSKVLKGLVGRTSSDASKMVKVLRELEKTGAEVAVYPDAETFIETRLLQKKLQANQMRFAKTRRSIPIERNC